MIDQQAANDLLVELLRAIFLKKLDEAKRAAQASESKNQEQQTPAATLTKEDRKGNEEVPNLDEVKREIAVADIKQFGEQLILPEGMSLEQALDLVKRRMVYEEEDMAINEPIDTFPWDGAYALNKAMSQRFGWTSMEATPGFFGSRPPAMIAIDLGNGRSTRVPWGRIRLPGVEGFIQTGVTEKEGRLIFQIGGTVKRKYATIVQDLADLTRKIALEESLYKGRAFRMKWPDVNPYDEPELPVVSFLDLNGVKTNELIFSREVEAAIRTSIYTPVERSAECRRLGIPLKRGVLLAGPYGTGKSLTASVTAVKCEVNGWTFLYLENADDLPKAVRFAKQYAPAAIFCEDIDRVMKGERTIDTDQILNIIDGIESKGQEIMIILTTNHVENIQQALLRPGRLDAVINVTPPDGEAVTRLIRLYGRGLVPDAENLEPVGKILAGQIPAVIRELVERSKLAAISLQNPGDPLTVTAEALLLAAEGMQAQLDLLKPKKQDNRTDLEKMGAIIGSMVKRGMFEARNYQDVDVEALAAEEN